MDITYNYSKKDLPPEQLRDLFVAVGWSDGGETPGMVQKGYGIPWINATLVVSAWVDERLIDAVRVLSDTMFRSIVCDLAVLPEYQNRGVGSELLRRCIERFPYSECLAQTTQDVSVYYYIKHGFKVNNDTFLTIPSKLFTISI